MVDAVGTTAISETFEYEIVVLMRKAEDAVTARRVAVEVDAVEEGLVILEIIGLQGITLIVEFVKPAHPLTVADEPLIGLA